MSAKKRSGSKTSNYLISTEVNPTEDRGAFSVLGKLRGDAFGSRYAVVDGGMAPDKAVVPSTLRKELGVVQFQFDSGGPSVITAWVPYVNSSGTSQVWYPTNKLVESDNVDMLNVLDSGKANGKLLQLVNVKPKWDDVHGGHVLNFQGRVTESSVKNFQLCCPELLSSGGGGLSDQRNDSLNSEVVLQFGKAGKDKFTMDVRYPLSIYTAFAMCVACLDGKLADRKGFELFRGLGSGVRWHSQNNSNNDKSDEVVHVQGSMQGGTTIGGGTSSAQYIKDKISRVLK
jgi:hypothetical protein